MRTIQTIVLLLLLSIQPCFAQTQEAVYLNPGDSTKIMFVAVRPTTEPVKGLLVLCPGAFQTPQYVLQQSDFPNYAAQNGLITINPLFSNGISSFGIDDSSQRSLTYIIKDAIRRYKMQGKPLFLSGLSLGGICAVRYAELAAQTDTLRKPDAVFAIDPPLDFERRIHSASSTMKCCSDGCSPSHSLHHHTIISGGVDRCWFGH